MNEIALVIALLCQDPQPGYAPKTQKQCYYKLYDCVMKHSGTHINLHVTLRECLDIEKAQEAADKEKKKCN
jgi:hypothetical protein